MTSSDAKALEGERLRAKLNHIYDNYRKGLMNYKYYAKRLAIVSRWNTVYEATLAVGASGTIASFPILQTGSGKEVWTLFAGAIAVLVTLKPFLQLSQKIKRLSKLHAGYQDLFFDLKQLVEEIETNHDVTEAARLVIDNANKRFQDLAREDDLNQSKKLLRTCFDEVNQQIPASKLWYPRSRQP